MAETAQKRRIDDAGEKIEGARKDWKRSAMEASDLDGMTDEEIALTVKKDNVWPKPDYEALVDGGMQPDAAALVKIIRDRMAQEPRQQHGADPILLRRLYVEMVSMVRDRLTACRTEQDVRSVYGLLKQQDFGGDFLRTDESKWKLFSIFKARNCPFHIDFSDRNRAGKMVAEGFPSKLPAWKKGLAVLPWESGFAIVRNRRIVKAGFSDEASALKWAEADYQNKGGKPKAADGKVTPDRPHLDVIAREGMPFSLEGRNVSPDDFLSAFGFRGVQFGLWLPDDERQRVLNMGYEALMDLADVLGWEPEALSLGGTLGLAFGARGKGGRAAAHYEPGQRVVNMTRMSGAGSLAHEYGHALDHWTGTGSEVAAPDGIPSATGWRTYVGKRSGILAHRGEEAVEAWDSAMDAIYRAPLVKEEAIKAAEKRIADIEEAIGRNRAGIERLRENGKRGDRARIKGALEWEAVQQAQIDVVRQKIEDLSRYPDGAMVPGTGSSYVREANKLCRSTGYWKEPTELFARAFEAWVLDEIAERGGASQYLVYGADETTFADDEFRGNPYPVGNERKWINGKMAALAAAMKPTVEAAMEPQSPAP